MMLKQLLEGVDGKLLLGTLNKDVKGISYNSNKIKKDYLFIAIKGEKNDGHSFVNSAVEMGANAVVLDRDPGYEISGVSVIKVKNTREALSEISANFYNNPTKDICLVGITGTNGKTTVTYIIEKIWNEESKNVGVIGTVNYRIKNKVFNSNMTTPESLELMDILSSMKSEGVDNVVMEVSSHAIDQSRVSSCQFDAVVFTNLTQDHLDYHSSIEEYMNTKKNLFTGILKKSSKKKKYSVINIDDPYGAQIAEEATGELITYSIKNKNASVKAESYDISRNGISALINTPEGNFEVKSKLLGEHNLSNILAAIATTISLGTPLNLIKNGVNNAVSIPGRLEEVDNSLDIKTLIDYAHTPDALHNVVLTVKKITDNKVILLFGCGGDRDKLKRPLMGKIGGDLADTLIVTSDNPRTENPEDIIKDIEDGVLTSTIDKENYFKITDRRKAIKFAINIASRGDTVLIAGKGHEDYQIVGNQTVYFDDKSEAAEALREKLNYT